MVSTAGLAAFGGMWDRRKQVIDAQRKRQGKREDIAEEIQLRADASTKSQIAVKKATLDAESEQFKQFLRPIASDFYKNLPSDQKRLTSVQEIAARITPLAGGTVQGLAQVSRMGVKNVLSITPSGGLNFRTPASPMSSNLDANLIKQTETVLGITQPGDPSMPASPYILQGIALAQFGAVNDETMDKAKDLMEDLTPEVQQHAVYSLANQIKQSSMQGGPGGLANPNFLKQWGSKFVGSIQRGKPGMFGTLFGEEDYELKPLGNVTSPTPRQMPQSTTVGADGNSTTSRGYRKPEIGDIVLGSKWTNATGNGRTDDRRNWEDASTGVPRS